MIKIIFFARFKKADMERLCQALDLPEKYTCYQGTTATSMEALMILLRRFSYPNHLWDLVPFFARAEEELIKCYFFKSEALMLLYNFKEILLSFNGDSSQFSVLYFLGFRRHT